MTMMPVPENTESVKVTAAPSFWRRLLRRKLAIVCLVYLAAVVVIAIVAPIALPHVAGENAGDLTTVRGGPSADHILGTDTLGRDVLERLLVGTRITLIGVAEALAVVLLLGVPVGLVAGYAGGWTDRVVGWLADLTFAMPAIIIILVVLAVFPQNMTAAMVTFGIIAAPGLMRIVRSATLPVREEPYVAAARVAGLSRPYIIFRHILPRIAGPVIVQASLIAAVALLVQTGLAFLALVVAAPAPSWGGMVADGVQSLELQPWLIWPPGIVIAATILVLGLLGDAVRDATTEGWNPAQDRPKRRATGHAVGHAAGSALGESLSDDEALLLVNDLSVVISSGDETFPVLDAVSFAIRPGETVGLVGESGCGKTMTAMALLGLLPSAGRVSGGSALFEGQDLVSASEKQFERIRGSQISLVSQEPMVGLNPVFQVGWQIAQAVRVHHPGMKRREARRRAIQLLGRVHLPSPERVARRYPHELSGGMAQRVAIARALAGEPKLLIADEPTTALDVTVQAEILDLLREIQQTHGMAILLVTHDLGVVADLCDRAIVMYAGQIVEQAPATSLFSLPRHPYTAALLAANPYGATGGGQLQTIPGAVPALGQWPVGCHFQSRCPYVTDACRAGEVPLTSAGSARQTRCIHHEEISQPVTTNRDGGVTTDVRA